MNKVIIFNDEDFLIGELEGKIETTSTWFDKENKTTKVFPDIPLRTAHFRQYKLIKSKTIRKELKKIERAIKYHKERKVNRCLNG